MLPLKPNHFWMLFMKAENPQTGQVQYFHDKTLPFGASISCALFQRFSNALRHVIEVLTENFHHVTNYLDDYLFIQCDYPSCKVMVKCFIDICHCIRFPVAFDKTEGPITVIVFWGVKLDGNMARLIVPEDKRIKAINMIQYFIDKKKAKVVEIQRLTGTLNFLNRAIPPGQIFMRRLYDSLTGFKLHSLANDYNCITMSELVKISRMIVESGRHF